MNTLIIIPIIEETTELANCLDCPFHQVLPDPDLHDWFCDDDVRVFCTKAEKNITVACRPHHVWKESYTPAWCPLIENENQYLLLNP